MTPGTKVWVSKIGCYGLGTVERIKKSGSLLVRMDSTGKTHVAHPDSVAEVTTLGAAKLHTLTHDPDYSPPLRKARPKQEPLRSAKYLAWIRKRPCAWTSQPGPSEASHHPAPGNGSIGAKTDDLRTIPLSTEAHREFHQRGTLGSMSRDAFERWAEEQINTCLRAYLREVGAV